MDVDVGDEGEEPLFPPIPNKLPTRSPKDTPTRLPNLTLLIMSSM